MRVTFLYTALGEEWSNNLYIKLLENLSVSEKERNVKYRRWQDRQANILGKLLLKHGLRLRSSKASVNKIEYNKYKKPYLESGPFFNISHSGDFVVCVIADFELGVDIEQKSEMDFQLFQNIFTAKEWELINSVDGGFHTLWSRKEAIIKANGKGLHIDLHDFEVLEQKVKLLDESYYSAEVDINEGYACSIAIKGTEIPVIDKSFIEVNDLILQQF